jgi:hypothetical protein
MGMGRSHEGCEGLSWENGVITKAPTPGDETKVLESRHRPADVRLAPPVAGTQHASLSLFRFAYRVSRSF